MPLVGTALDSHPAVCAYAPKTFNAIVAVVTGGDNVEDSLIISKASVERGLFAIRNRNVKTFSVRHRASTSAVEETFTKPQEGLPGMHGSSDYSKIDDDGFPSIGSRVEASDIIAGSHSVTMQYDPSSHDFTPKTVDTSFPLRKHESPPTLDTRVSKVMKVHNQERILIRVAMDQLRIAQIGDKFASRHGQKGLCGSLLPQEDMPFCASDGMTPDILFNPHGGLPIWLHAISFIHLTFPHRISKPDDAWAPY